LEVNFGLFSNQKRHWQHRCHFD